ncbi:hypothetical protein AB0E10_01695 [Streptomyces sp. NPDC048045]|uniref:hypothetical protein n=1 Tax=Streptomyces sp. NPDC048045 TaxID=3154710 RepID=UPI00342A0B06
MDAADAGNRYMVALDDIDVTDFTQREEYVFAILDPIGRARVEAHALPEFPGIEEVRAAIRRLEMLVRVPESSEWLLETWDPKGIGEAAKLLSRGRSAYMREVMQPERQHRFRLRESQRQSLTEERQQSELPSVSLWPDISG